MDVVIFVTIVNGQWFFVLPLALFSIWYWPSYIEIVIAGIMYDALFGMVHGSGLRGWTGTIVSIVLYAIAVVVKKFVRK